MKIDAWQDHIVIDPSLHHGDPCIKRTRVPVSMILGSLADGMTPSEIQDAYPQLSIDNIYATLAYAAQMVRCEIFAPLPLMGAANAS